jgi:hypothetical protein
MAFLRGHYFLYTDRLIGDDPEPYILETGANADGNFYPSSRLDPDFPWITGHYDDSSKTIAFHSYWPGASIEKEETTTTYFTGSTMDDGETVIAMNGWFQQVTLPSHRPNHPVFPTFEVLGHWTAVLLPTRFPFPLTDLLQEYTVIRTAEAEAVGGY